MKPQVVFLKTLSIKHVTSHLPFRKAFVILVTHKIRSNNVYNTLIICQMVRNIGFNIFSD